MTPIEVLKMLKSKIDKAGMNNCNYVIERSDIEAISEALTEPLSKLCTIPDDLDDILIEAERLGFVFHEGKWKQSGYRDRNMSELYKFLKNEI